METICRTCLSKDEPVFSIHKDDIPLKIKAISAVEVKMSDSLPSTICKKCIETLNLCYEFRVKIINSDYVLKLISTRDSDDPELDKTISVEKIEIISQVKDDEEVVEYEEDLQEYDSSVKSEVELEGDEENEEIFFEENSNPPQEEKSYSCNEIEDPEDISDEELQRLKKVAEKFSAQERNIGNRKALHRCSDCDFKTDRSRLLEKHKSKYHPLKKVCSICGKYIRAENLTKHIKTHSNDESVTCPICYKVFKNPESYRSHPVMHIEENSICEICGKQFQVRGEHLRHMRVHKVKEKKLKCMYAGCEKMFRDKKDLDKHHRSHTGERPYPCKFCGKKFSSTHALKTHTRKHTNERPFACTQCYIAFHQKISDRKSVV